MSYKNMIDNKELSAKNIIIIDKNQYTNEESEIFISIEECKRALNLPKNCYIGEIIKRTRKIK